MRFGCITWAPGRGGQGYEIASGPPDRPATGRIYAAEAHQTAEVRPRVGLCISRRDSPVASLETLS